MTTDAPIDFTCSCGKRLKAKTHAAGRSIRCPGCGQPVIVPGPLPAADDDDDFAAFAGLGSLPEIDIPQPAPVQRAADPLPAQVPSPSIRIAAHESSLPMTRSYPAMEIIAKVCRILAGLVAVVALFAIVAGIVFAVKTSDLSFAIAVVPMGLLGLLFALLLVMTAESIKLGIDIQANTLATAHASRRASG